MIRVMIRYEEKWNHNDIRHKIQLTMGSHKQQDEDFKLIHHRREDK